MKKLFAIAAAIAITTFTMTGCNPTGSSSYTDVLLTGTEAVTNGVTTTTEFEYDENGTRISEIQYVGARKVYEIGDYKAEEGSNFKWSSIRTDYAENGTTTTTTSVTTYGSYGETEYKVTDASGAVIELRETTYGSNGSPSEFKHTVNGTVVLHRTDFDYTYFTGSDAYYTYKESKDGGEPVTMYYDLNKIVQIGNRLEYVEYEIHAGSRTGTPIKEQSDYEANQMTDTYKVVEYDAQRLNPVTTTVDRTYKSITVTY